MTFIIKTLFFFFFKLQSLFHNPAHVTPELNLPLKEDGRGQWPTGSSVTLPATARRCQLPIAMGSTRASAEATAMTLQGRH